MAEFSVSTTTRFDRLARSLDKRHPRMFTASLKKAVGILRSDPYNLDRRFAIKKLVDVPAGHGQYRLRIGRFRFRYDVTDQIVFLVRCSLRREDSYR